MILYCLLIMEFYKQDLSDHKCMEMHVFVPIMTNTPFLLTCFDWLDIFSSFRGFHSKRSSLLRESSDKSWSTTFTAQILVVHPLCIIDATTVIVIIDRITWNAGIHIFVRACRFDRWHVDAQSFPVIDKVRVHPTVTGAVMILLLVSPSICVSDHEPISPIVLRSQISFESWS